jgi:hypothetical protein
MTNTMPKDGCGESTRDDNYVQFIYKAFVQVVTAGQPNDIISVVCAPVGPVFAQPALSARFVAEK